jgi:hypothetical protein
MHLCYDFFFLQKPAVIQRYDNGDGHLDDDEMMNLLREVSGAPKELITM